MPIEFQNVSYVYNRKSPFEYAALRNVDLIIPDHKFVALVGRTGSGKSTLVSHINALLRPSEGQVKINDFLLERKNRLKGKDIKELRKHVGLVFQFPEYQLFEETVEKDVAFGPKNFGAKGEEAISLAHEALQRVGLDESFYDRSPFELSGGEKRKVAIAGVLAMKPEVLIVDEPTAGLDPAASEEMMELFKTIQKEGVTLILVTHDMNIVSKYADLVVVMEDGKVAKIATPKELFSSSLDAYSLELPLLYRFVNELKERGFQINEDEVKDTKDLARCIKRGLHV